MKDYLNRYPTVENLRALELAAHRARSRELLRLIRTGASGVKALAERLVAAAHVGGRIGHA